MNRDFIINLIESEMSYSREPEVNLMRAVVKQAFLDVLIISDNAKYLKRKREAQEWLGGDSSDMKMVCMLALLDQARVKMLYELILSTA